MNAGDVMATSAALVMVTHIPAESRDAVCHLGYRVGSTIAQSPAMSVFSAGMIAGSVSRTMTAPLDRIKSLAQEGRIVSSAERCEFRRMTTLSRHIYLREGGITAFWRGNGINCLKAGPEYAVTFSTRQWLANRFCLDPAGPSAGENFALGAMGGLVAQLSLYPLEITKTRMAVSRQGEYTGICNCVKQSVRRGGVPDLYRGLGANLAGVVPHRSIEMGVFFSLEQALRRWRLQSGQSGELPMMYVSAAGFAASIVSQVATYPLNLVRTKLQTQGVNNRPVLYTGMWDCLATVARREGIRGLFAGLAPNMLKAAPASTIMYSTFHCVTQKMEELRRD